jgi:hypothetical protein
MTLTVPITFPNRLTHWHFTSRTIVSTVLGACCKMLQDIHTVDAN